MGTFTRQLRDPAAGCPRDQTMGCSSDGCETSVKRFLNTAHKHIKLILTG